MPNYRFSRALATCAWLALSGLHGCGGAGHASKPSDGGTASPPSNGVSQMADSGIPVIGQVEGVQTKLPPLPELTNVQAVPNDDSVSITFDPVDGARDYRVYPLPSDADISTSSDGSTVIQNAIYRCAGDRETPSPTIDNGPMVPGSAIHTQVDQQKVGGYTRSKAEATLGYVYTQPADGLVPVYALGQADPQADSTCYFARWAASRVKRYTTSDSERAQFLSQFARDDGIAFYVPATADGATTQIYTDVDGVGTPWVSRYYFAEGPEANMHPNKVPAFAVRTSSGPGTTPLMRVFYGNSCGWAHDELATGQERFNRIYKQGDTQPWWSLLWTGITQPTTLVVEALDTGCPFQGHLSPASIASVTVHFGSSTLVHPPYVTIDDVRAASPTTEVFINGQHEPANRPRAIARSFVKAAPRPHAPMDFFATFSSNTPPESFSEMACGAPGGNCLQTWRQHSATFDSIFIYAENGPTSNTGLYAFGPVLGELWVNYADTAGDTNGKFRLTANQKANMDSSNFLHVTMEVDGYSTSRRYPQILISDQDAPIQYTLDKGHTIIAQLRAQINSSIDYPVEYQLQVCNMRSWDVNNQCPVYDLYHVKDASGKTIRLAPNDEVGEHTSADHRILFDVYASTQRTYLFLDGQPYACANMPSSAVPSGPVTVTWADVLYHSAVDHLFAFHTAHMQIDTKRHFDNLGFSSGVPPPPWDESRLPCAAPITL
jgi:hypothetical protein